MQQVIQVHSLNHNAMPTQLPLTHGTLQHQPVELAYQQLTQTQQTTQSTTPTPTDTLSAF